MIVSNVDGTYGYAARIVGGDVCLTGTGNVVSSTGTSVSNEPIAVTPSEEVAIFGNYLKMIPRINYDDLTSKYSNIIINDNLGNIINSGNIATGYKVTIDGTTYTVVKKGDITGDGNVDIIDVVALLNHVKGKNNLTDQAQLEAAKLKNNDEINISDIIVLLNNIKEKGNITL